MTELPQRLKTATALKCSDIKEMKKYIKEFTTKMQTLLDAGKYESLDAHIKTFKLVEIKEPVFNLDFGDENSI